MKAECVESYDAELTVGQIYDIEEYDDETYEVGVNDRGDCNFKYFKDRFVILPESEQKREYMKVRCTSTPYSDDLTVGKVYDAVDRGNMYTVAENDLGLTDIQYSKHRFKPLYEPTEAPLPISVAEITTQEMLHNLINCYTDLDLDDPGCFDIEIVKELVDTLLENNAASIRKAFNECLTFLLVDMETIGDVKELRIFNADKSKLITVLTEDEIGY